MNLHKALMHHYELTQEVIGCAYRVYNTLGFPFLESVYQNALGIELRNAGIPFEMREPIQVSYQDEVVGIFEADLLVAGKVLIELKAIRTLHAAHEAQLVNYLAATGIDVGLLINFGETGLEVKRKLRHLPRRRSASIGDGVGESPFIPPEPFPVNPSNPANPV